MVPSAFLALPLPVSRPRVSRLRSQTCPNLCATTPAEPRVFFTKTPDNASLLTVSLPPSNPPADQTALFLHDFMTDHRLFSELIPPLHKLSPQTHLVSYDLRGFGRTSPPTAPYSRFSDMISVTQSVSPLHLVAVGMSGPLALEFALAHPSRVASLVLIGSGLPGYRWPPPRWMDLSESREGGLMRRLTGRGVLGERKELVGLKKRFIGGHEGWEKGLRGGGEAEKVLVEMAREYEGWHFWEREECEPDNFGEEPLINRLEGVQCRTLVMVGEEEGQEFGEIAEIIRTGVEGGRERGVVRIKGGAHFVVLEQAELVAKQIASFWSEKHM